MGSLNNYVTVTVTRNTTGVTQLGFGVALILSQTASFPERVRTYSNYAAGAVDFSDVTSPENLALLAAFSQSPAPTSVKIGRRANKSTQVYSVTAITAVNPYTYKLWVQGVGVARQLVTFATSASPTTTTVATGMTTALNAVASKNFTATSSGAVITITANAAGGWFHIEAADTDGNAAVTDFTIVQTHSDPGVTADLTAIAAADANFYGIYNFSNASAEGTAIAAWTEANSRTFICDSNESQTINTVVGSGTDLLAALKTAAYTRTMGFYHHRLDQMPGAALYGRCFPLLPGYVTFADKGLTGVDPTPLTSTNRANIVARNANGYEPVGSNSVGITFQGMCANGGFMDTIRFLDAFTQDAQVSIFNTKLNNNIIAYDDPGIRKIASQFKGSIDRYTFTDGGSGFLPGSVSLVVPLRANVAPSDVSSRVLNGIRAQAQLSSAIGLVNVAINVIGG